MSQADLNVTIGGKTTHLERDLEAAGKRIGRNLGINIGKSSKSIDTLSQPLGRITGKADEFTKSMEAANARVLAFGASVGVLGAITKGFKDLVTTTISVEKQLTSINTILGGSTGQLDKFSKKIFEVARNTEQSFEVVADAALELSRQGLAASEVTQRLNDALVLSRLTGQGAAEAVSGLTAAINSFNASGITSAEVLNKLSAAAISAAVSEKDLIEGVKRSGSVAVQAGVSFDELVGIIGAVQEKTARGGAVIGNSFKTIFTRLQSLEKLETMQNLGVQVTDASGTILSATQLIQNLGKTIATLPDAKRLQIAENLVGKFQIAPFLALLEDYNSESSKAIALTKTAQEATTQAYQRNAELNKTLSSILNEVKVQAAEVAAAMGKIGIDSALKGWMSWLVDKLETISGLLDKETGNKGLIGAVKAMGRIFSGPGLAIAGAIILKMVGSLLSFGLESVKTFFGINAAAKEQAALQGMIGSSLLTNEDLQQRILKIENSRLDRTEKTRRQALLFTSALNEQYAVMAKMQGLASTLAPIVHRGTSARGKFLQSKPQNFAGGYGGEVRDIAMGVGGAPSNAQPVGIPNFNFGGGMKGPVVANNSEFIVPNFGGGGGSAIFNQDMVSSMGLPAGARPINAAGGVTPKKKAIPNALITAEHMQAGSSKNIGRDPRFAMITPERGFAMKTAQGTANNGARYRFNVFGTEGMALKTRDQGAMRGDIEKTAVKLANKELTPFRQAKIPVETIKKVRLNQGALGGMAGTIFEAAVRATTTQFKRLGSTNNDTFDFFGAQVPGLRKNLYPNIPSTARFIEAKGNSSTRDNVNSMAQKMARFGAGNVNINEEGSKQMLALHQPTTALTEGRGAISKRRQVGKLFGVPLHRAKSSARGYTPNFSKGFLPNFAKGSFSWNTGLNKAQVTEAGHKWNKAGADAFRKEQAAMTKDFKTAGKSAGNLTMKLVGLQLVTSGLTGAFGDAEEGWGRAMGQISAGMEKVSAGFLIADVTKDWGENMEGFGGALGKLGAKLGMVAGVLTAVSGVFGAVKGMVQDYNGTTKMLDDSFSKLKDTTDQAVVSLEGLSRERKTEIKYNARDLLEGIQVAQLVADEHSDRGDQTLDPNKLGGMVIDKQVKEEVLKAIRAGLAEGMDPVLIKSIIREGARSTGRLDKETRFDVEDLPEFEKLFGKEFGGRRRLIESLKGRDLPENLMNPKAGLDFVSGGKGGRGSIIERERDDFAAKLAKKHKTTPEAAREELDKKIDQQKLATAIKLKEANRGIAFEVIQRIKLEADLAKLNNKALDDITDQLTLMEAVGTSTKENLKFTKLSKADIDASNKKRNETLNSVKALAALSKELTMEDTKEKAVIDAIHATKRKGTITEKERVNLLKLTKDLTSESGKEIGRQVTDELNRLKTAEATVDTERARTKQLILQKFTTEEILELQREGIAGEKNILNRIVTPKITGLKAQSETSAALSARKGIGPQTILSREAAGVSKAGDALGRTGIDTLATRWSELRSDLLRVASSKIVSQDQRLFTRGTESKEEAFLRNAVAELQEFGIDKFNLPKFIGEQLEDPNLTNQREKLIQSIKDEDVNRLMSAAASKKAAETSLLVAKLAGEVLTELQIEEDIATNLRRGKNKATVDAKLGIDPASRAKGLMTAGNRFRKADAIDAKNYTLYRQILEQELLAGQLIDASQQFAQNIGNAMVDAIAKGQNLGDTLMGAASDFFYMMSKALMQNAVNSIVSGGPGGSGFFGGLFKGMIGYNSGGQVRGGSGSRDDVPALLTGGEFIMNKGAVQNYGAGFMGALNTGSVPKYANGGLFTPGTYGQGSISGSSNLLKFATQSYTGGLQDTFLSGSGLGGLTLEPQSGRLTMFGRKNSPAFQKEQESKRKAFDLFSQQYSKNAEAKKAKEQSSGNLLGSILAFGASAVASHLTGGGLSSLFTKGKATGGAVPYSAGIDSVPTMLSGGEFVMNAAATQKLGAGNLAALNSGGGTSGGSGNQIVGKLDELNETIASSNTEINITVNSDGTENTNAGDAPNQQRGLAVKIKDVVRQVIEDEKRLGGSLRMA